MSDLCHCSVRSVRTVPCKLTFPLVICDSVLVPRYEFELLQEHFPRERVSNSAFRSATAAVLCQLKAVWFLLPPSHTFQNFRARLKLPLKLLFRPARCYFPIVTTCFDFLISFEAIDLEPNYIKTLCEVREFVMYFKYRTFLMDS